MPFHLFSPWPSIYNTSHWKVITGLVCLIRSVWLWFSGWFHSEWEWRVCAGEGLYMCYTSQIPQSQRWRDSSVYTAFVWLNHISDFHSGTPLHSRSYSSSCWNVAAKQAVEQPDTSCNNLSECNTCTKWVKEVKWFQVAFSWQIFKKWGTQPGSTLGMVVVV